MHPWICIYKRRYNMYIYGLIFINYIYIPRNIHVFLTCKNGVENEFFFSFLENLNNMTIIIYCTSIVLHTMRSAIHTVDVYSTHKRKTFRLNGITISSTVYPTEEYYVMPLNWKPSTVTELKPHNYVYHCHSLK